MVAVGIAVGAAGAAEPRQEPCPPYASEDWDGGSPNGWGRYRRISAHGAPFGGELRGFLRADNAGLIAVQTSSAPWIGDWGATTSLASPSTSNT